MSKGPLQTKLCDQLGVELPIVASTHCKDVAAAVINSGGFAVLAEAASSADEIAADIAWLRERVDGKPFGIELALPVFAPAVAHRDELSEQIPESHRRFERTILERYEVPRPKGPVDLHDDLHEWDGVHEPRGQARLDVLLDERVPVITAELGNQKTLLEAAHARGCLVWGLADSTREARRQLEAGVDAIIAQGYDAAGRTGEMGTFSIVAEIAAHAGATPVLAAGGVTTGRHLAAALCLGASGVWTRTLWLACHESHEDLLIKQKLIGAEAGDTVRSVAITGSAMRVLCCPWTDEWKRPEAPRPLDPPLQRLLSADYIQGANDHARTDLMTVPCGQGVGSIDEIKSARQIVLDMVEDALGTLDELIGECGAAE